MHGLVNKAIEKFVRDSYGAARWSDVARRADLHPPHFEAMLHYDDAITDRVLAVVAALLDRPREAVLEDIGTYLVSHPGVENLRRLLRFGGTDYDEFLHSLEDMPGRVRLAVPDLDLPRLDLEEKAPGRYRLSCGALRDGFGHVLTGLLRAMADDYGALACVEHRGSRRGVEAIDIALVERGFAAGRHFDLGARAG